MTSNTASLITSTGATVFVDGKIYTVSPDHANFKAICEAITAGNLGDIPDLCDLRTAVRKWMRTAFSGDFKMVGDQLRYKNYTFGVRVTEKALAMIDAGNNAKPLLNFLAKVCENPSNVAREELLLFCDANGFMITSEGNIVAYKAVRDDYMDIHSGTVRYMVGDAPFMDRGAVDDDRNNTCSHGLHFAAKDYATMFGGGRGHMMAVEVNPADVVSIPADYNNQKGRAWKLTVIAEITEPLPEKEVYNFNPVTQAWQDEADDEWGDFDLIDDDFFSDDDDLPEVELADEDDDEDDDTLYGAGFKAGFGHRSRQYPKGYYPSYDNGYRDGRADS